jgi:hypothetical protein
VRAAALEREVDPLASRTNLAIAKNTHSLSRCRLREDHCTRLAIGGLVRMPEPAPETQP